MALNKIFFTYLHTSESPLTDPRDAEAQHVPIFRIASYGNQTTFSTRPKCWIQISTVGVINSCSTTFRSLWHSPAN